MRRWLLPVLCAVLVPWAASGTVQEQRNRLPPPPEPDTCADAVSGTWLAHVYYGHVGDWYRFTLHLDLQGAQIHGRMHAGWWTGGPKDAQAPACAASNHFRSVDEPVQGTFRDGVLDVLATEWATADDSCRPVRGYLVDRFTGRLDPEIQEFQSLLNADAPEWRDVPTVFRRIRCTHQERPVEPDPIVTVPPPFQPPTRGVSWRGCGGSP